ncbi:ATP-binding protein [Sphingomonas sp. MMS12-HWE2-04]|uniref:ATP-binding protein n=1 Tax=Sphingomonas sp. MMS12-HWE2-04 TaxID=3234199 RepID=UPI00384E95E6
MTIGSNLSLRLAAILLVGFIALQILVVAVALPSSDDARRPYNLPRPEEAAAIAAALDRAPLRERAGLVDALEGGGYSVALSPARPAPERGSGTLRDVERRYDAAMPGRQVEVDGRRGRIGRLIGPTARPARFFAPIRIVIPLHQGGVLLFTNRPSNSALGYLRRRAVMGALGGLVLLVALMVAVRQTTRPLSQLSQGVRRFAGNLDTPDLPIAGPREVRALAAAFNDMKAQIRALMGERTRVLAAIAHDLRTYLTRLRLRAEYIDDVGHRSRAIADLDEMTALLNDTLLLADRDGAPPNEPERVGVADALAAIVGAHLELAEPVTLMHVPADLAIAATPLSLRRILDNLIANAVRHGNAVTVAAHARGTTVDIVVEDDGPGVPSAALAGLGTPFHRLDPSRDRETGGAGLGLAIVRALASRDRAEVLFAQAAGTGLRVTIRYPSAGN